MRRWLHVLATLAIAFAGVVRSRQCPVDQDGRSLALVLGHGAARESPRKTWQAQPGRFHRGPSMALRFRKSQMLAASVGAALAVSALAYVAKSWEGLMLLGSFGASALLVFALPDGHLSQPRSVIGGHLLASAIALVCLGCFGPEWWAVGLSTGAAIGFMMLTRTLHPPAGANAIIVFFAKPSPLFLMSSTLAGATGLVLLAVVYHRIIGRQKYPIYWRSAPASS